MHRCFGLASNKSCQTNASVFEDLGIKKLPNQPLLLWIWYSSSFFFFFAKLTFLISFLSLHHTHKFGFAAGVIPHTRWSPVVPDVLGMIGKCESPIRDLEQMWASSEKSSGAFFWDRTHLRTWLFVHPCKVLSLRQTRLSTVGPLNTWQSTQKPHSGRQ